MITSSGSAAFQCEGTRRTASSLKARRREDRAASRLFFGLTALPILLAILVTLALGVRALPMLREYSLLDLLTSSTWRPAQGQFGYWPFIAGTFWVTAVGVVLAVPPCLLTALYLSEYARASTRAVMKPLLDLLAAIPSVVYGVWGVISIVPLVNDVLKPFSQRTFPGIGFFTTTNPTGYGILTGGIVLAVMIAPFIIAVTYEVLATVLQGAREASLALGATRLQTIRAVVFRQTLPGILAGIVLGATRALGETMAVLMVVGNVPQVPRSIFDTAYPLPALIANNYGEMMSIPMYDAALLGAAFILLIIILAFNITSTLVLQQRLGKNWV